MQVRLRLTYCFFFLILANAIRAQEINYTVAIYPASCMTTPDGGVVVNVIPSNPPYTYLWNFGDTTNGHRSMLPGNYTLTIRDAAGNDTVVNVLINTYGGICDISPEPVFTPNDDGFNDTWSIINIERYPNSMILIFNRWGQKIVDRSGTYEPWDGKDLLGIPAPDGAYYYIIYKDRNNEGTIVKGSVSIIR